MRRVIIAILAVWPVTAAGQEPDGMLLNMPGYMAPVQDLDCLSAGEVAAEHSPPDLALSMARCLTAGRYDAAAELYLLITLRSLFDTLRVADATGHDAGQQVLRIVSAHMGPTQRAGMSAAFEALGGTGSAWHGAFCARLRAGVPPAHDPSYMVFHGQTGPLEGGDAPLIEGFDPEAAWDRVLTGYMECGG